MLTGAALAVAWRARRARMICTSSAPHHRRGACRAGTTGQDDLRTGVAPITGVALPPEP
jgi:hypothetical protein